MEEHPYRNLRQRRALSAVSPRYPLFNIFDAVCNYISIVVACQYDLFLAEDPSNEVVDQMRSRWIDGPTNISSGKTRCRCQLKLGMTWNGLGRSAAGSVHEYSALVCGEVELQTGSAVAPREGRRVIRCTLERARSGYCGTAA